MVQFPITVLHFAHPARPLHPAADPAPVSNPYAVLSPDDRRVPSREIPSTLLRAPSEPGLVASGYPHGIGLTPHLASAGGGQGRLDDHTTTGPQALPSMHFNLLRAVGPVAQCGHYPLTSGASCASFHDPGEVPGKGAVPLGSCVFPGALAEPSSEASARTSVQLVGPSFAGLSPTSCLPFVRTTSISFVCSV